MPNQASTRLKHNEDKIMQLWEQRANAEVLAAYQLESLALRDSLPELLSQLSDALSTIIDRTTARVKWDRSESLRIGKKHGHERAGSSDYTMDQMITEYHILREVICDVLEEEKPLSLVEREVITCAIEQAVNDAATQFSETLRLIQARLASALTHDLRSPITSAKLTAQMILRRTEGVDEITRSAVSRIVKGMDRVDLMIHDLLDASLIRAGEQLPLKLEKFDLNALAQGVIEDFSIIYGKRFIANPVAPVSGFWSESALRRVIENLLNNAVKYGALDVPIILSIQQSGSMASLSVHNQGDPIPLSDQAILFQQYRRTRSANSHVGWGLGLMVVKGITEAHHGTVRVESAQGEGTTFTIDLPLDARTS